MSYLIFQRLDHAERLQAILRQIGQTESTAIVFSTRAATLADTPQPPKRNGHRIIRLLFNNDVRADSFNPLDVLSYMTAMDLEVALTVLLEPLKPVNAENLGPSRPSGISSEPAWRLLAAALLQSLVQYQVQQRGKDVPLIDSINYLYKDDATYALAVLLDSQGKLMDPNIFAIISAVLAKTDEQRSAILSIAQGVASCLNTSTAQRLTERTSFDLDLVINNGATVYVEIPHFSCSHSLVARLWFGAFLQLAAASSSHEQRILFIVDNAARLEIFPQLLAAQRLLAGTLAGTMEVWSFWESLGQLSARHPADWSAFVGSCRGVQAWGPQSPAVAAELAVTFRASAVELENLAPSGRYTLSGESSNDLAITSEPAKCIEGGHHVAFAPSHSGKWREVAATILSRPQSSVFVLESAGQCHALTAPGRSAMGRVVRLDPFGVLGEASDQFNPLDLLKAKASALSTDVYQIAEQLVTTGSPSVDPFWNNYSINLVRAVIQYIRTMPEKAQTLVELWDAFHDDKFIGNLRTALDTIGKNLPLDCYRELSMFSQHHEIFGSRVLAEVTKSLMAFGVRSVRRAVERTTFDLDLVSVGGSTVYIEIPPHLWCSHGQIARLWIWAFMQLAVASGSHEHPSLFVVENAAGLEMFPQLLAAQQLPAKAIEVWSFWESLGVLSVKYPADWSAFVGSCQTVEAWGPQSTAVANELASAFGVSAEALGRLAPGSRSTLSGAVSSTADPGITLEPEKSEIRGHIVTFTSSRVDKWERVSAVILEQPRSSLVVVEPAGRCYALTVAGRSEVGRVVRLDPFGVLGEPSDQFNPLDLLRTAEPSANADALLFADLLLPREPATVDRFWRINTSSLIYGLLIYLSAVPEKNCNLIELRNILASDDIVYNLAVVLDTIGKRLPIECYQSIASFLQGADNTRSSLTAIAYQALRIFGNPLVGNVVENSSFSLSELVNQAPVTVYIELPISRLPSHSLLARLWVSSLFALWNSGGSTCRVQFILDSPFSGDLFPIFSPMQTSSIVEIRTFWDSLGQLRSENPAEWSAFLANAKTVEVIGPQSPVVAAELAHAFGYPQQIIQSLSKGQVIIL